MRIIYGAGDFGKKLYYFLHAQGIKIDYFCQTEVKGQSTVLGIEVISVEQLKEMSDSKEIYISVDNASVSKQIKNNLLLQCSPKDTVYACGSFIRENLRESGEKYCCLCGHHVEHFLPGGIKEELFEKRHIIGGGYRDGMICPVCGSIDRGRWLMRVLSKETEIFSKCKKRVLHFAPEGYIREFLQDDDTCDYYPADITGGESHTIDVTAIPFKEDTFDYIIINHVLEHVPDEKKALSELKRVLKKEGHLVLSFPICTDVETYEDISITTLSGRLAAFGQEDHVRLYGSDYKEHIEAAGFKVRVYSPQNECTEDEIACYGFIKDDVIMVCDKCC